MDFSPSEEQAMLKKEARKFLETECPESKVREIMKSEEGHSPELWKRIAELGWLGLVFPEKYGGTGAGILDLTVLCEEMGRALFPSPFLSTVVLCGQTIVAAGTEKQKASLIPKIINGDLVLALALAEPESSWDGTAWDPEGVTVSATPSGDDYIISGTKLFVYDAKIADYLLVVTRTGEGVAEEGITLFLVDAKSPRVSCTPLKTTARDRQYEVIFDKVRVPNENMIGEIGNGWAPLAKAMQIGAIMLCAEMVGAGQRVLELAVDYAKARIQFDMPIGINQYVQDHCVHLVSDVDTSKWITYLAAWKLSEGLPCDLEVSAAKAWVSDAHERACWRAHQVFAGVGSTEALGVMPLYTRRANSAQLYLGSANYHLEKVAKELEKLSPPEKPKGKRLGLWDKPEDEQVSAWEVWRVAGY